MKLGRFLPAVAWLAAIITGPSSVVEAALAPVLGIDLGSEFFKVAALSPGRSLDLLLNEQSKRKTNTAAVLDGSPRKFGAAAVAQQTSQPNVTLQYVSFRDIGRSDSHLEAMKAKPNGFPVYWYPYNVTTVPDRKTLGITISSSNSSIPALPAEEIFGHIFSHIRDLVDQNDRELTFLDTASQDIEAAFVIPVGFSYRQRELIQQAAQLAGIKPVAFVPAPAAAAIAHALDLSNPSERPKEPRLQLFLSMGARDVQACMVKFSTRKLGSSDSTEVVSTQVLHCLDAPTVPAGHHLDIAIAETWLSDILAEHRLEASAITPRNRRRLIKEANKAKHMLSSNVDTQVFVEGVARGVDLSATMSRADLEKIVDETQLLSGVEELIQQFQAFYSAHTKEQHQQHAESLLKVLHSVEVVGNLWRIPYVHQGLTKIVAPAELGQHCNSDESMAIGAAMTAANHSSSYKFRPLYFELPIASPLEVKFTPETQHAESLGSIVLGSDFLLGSKASTQWPGKGNFYVDLVDSTQNPELGEATLLHKWKVEGVDMATKLRKLGRDRRNDQRTKFENLTASIEDPKLRPVWIPADTIPPGAESEHINVTFAVSVTQLGLVEISSATASWWEPSVSELTKDVIIDASLATAAAESSSSSSTKSSSTDGSSLAKLESEKNDSQIETANKTTEGEKETTAPGETAALPTFKEFKESWVRHSRKLTWRSHDRKNDVKKTLIRPLPYSSGELRKAKDALVTAVKADRTVQETQELRNRLEAEIYEKRKLIRSDEIAARHSQDELDQALSFLGEEEEWLYEEGFIAEIATVQKHWDAVQNNLKAFFPKIETTTRKSKGSTQKAVKNIDEMLAKLAELKKSGTSEDYESLKAQFEEYLTAAGGDSASSSGSAGDAASKLQQLRQAFSAAISVVGDGKQPQAGSASKDAAKQEL